MEPELVVKYSGQKIDQPLKVPVNNIFKILAYPWELRTAMIFEKPEEINEQQVI